MTHFSLICEGEQVLINRVSAQCGEREGSDKLSASTGEHAPHCNPLCGQQPDQFQRLIRGNAAGDNQQHPCGGGTQVGHSSPNVFCEDISNAISSNPWETIIIYVFVV